MTIHYFNENGKSETLVASRILFTRSYEFIFVYDKDGNEYHIDTDSISLIEDK